mmetsp:Transcript_62272/g.150070  ORF Transcript_62272/g.150070 Transcript_62272/m.150070 type:complete len:246 (-) Transcript_62272:23-760(-)
MAAQSTFEAQSFPDHTSAPFSTTTSLATPSAMSTAWLGIDVSKSTEVGESLVAVVTVYSRSTVAMSALPSPTCSAKTDALRKGGIVPLMTYSVTETDDTWASRWRSMAGAATSGRLIEASDVSITMPSLLASTEPSALVSLKAATTATISPLIPASRITIVTKAAQRNLRRDCFTCSSLPVKCATMSSWLSVIACRCLAVSRCPSCSWPSFVATLWFLFGESVGMTSSFDATDVCDSPWVIFVHG